jgi:putative serine protease PepD
MSQDMPPRPSDQWDGDRSVGTPGAADSTESAASARHGLPPVTPAASPRGYAAPSPSDQPTAGRGSTGYPGSAARPAAAWSQQMDSDTGPVPVQPAQTDQGWWRPRPSGAWSAPTWGDSIPQAGATSSDPTARPAPTYAQAWSSGGSTGAYPAYRPQGYGPATGTPTPGVPGSASSRKSRRGTALVATAAAVALLAGFAGGFLGGQLASNSSSSDSSLTQLNTSAPVSENRGAAPAGSVQEVAATVLPSTVSVLASSSTSGGEGSGIILTADGLILTNNHVVEGATDLQVRFNDGTTATAEVVGKTASDDLAVIKAQGVSGLSPATLGSSGNLLVGQPVVAIGSPLGLSATVTSGIVSALNRPVRTSSTEQTQGGQAGQDTVMNAVQTDAAINPGNSGGALVDMSGAVIGINSAIASLSTPSDGSQAGSIGVGFAIPIDQAKRIAQEIINTGKATHAVLGASVRDASSGSSQISSGAELADITSGSGAAAAGLQSGDVVTKVGGQSVESADALIAAIRSAQPGGTTDIIYTRGPDTETVTVTLGSAPAS